MVREDRSEFCLALGNRKAFFELCDEITEGKVSVVVSEFKNRFSRVPCQLRLLEHIAEKQNCQLVFLDCEENEGEEKANMLELIDYIQHLSAKSAGRKSSLVTTVHLKQETIELITSLSNKGHTQRQIISIVQKLDHRDSKGKKIGRHVLRKYILLNVQVKTILGQSKEEQSNLIQLLTEWVEKNIESCEGSHLTAREISGRYNEWARENGKAPVVPTLLGRFLIGKMGFVSFDKRMPKQQVHRAFRNIAWKK